MMKMWNSLKQTLRHMPIEAVLSIDGFVTPMSGRETLRMEVEDRLEIGRETRENSKAIKTFLAAGAAVEVCFIV